MGGLIVLDFIDMKSRRDQQQVYQRIKDGLRRDRAKTHVLPISQLGLMEMTRQRHSESVRSAVYDDCPYCKGRGKVKSAITMSVEIQRKLNEILKKRSRDESDFQLRIAVHPTVLERLRTEDEKLIIEMEKRYFGKLSFRPETDFPRRAIQDRQRGHQRGTGQRWLLIQRKNTLRRPEQFAGARVSSRSPNHPRHSRGARPSRSPPSASRRRNLVRREPIVSARSTLSAPIRFIAP